MVSRRDVGAALLCVVAVQYWKAESSMCGKFKLSQFRTSSLRHFCEISRGTVCRKISYSCQLTSRVNYTARFICGVLLRRWKVDPFERKGE
jgi:hypothetical protein